MRPTPIRPKRSDYASFDDYFDAMIEFHLNNLPENIEELQPPTSFVQSFDTVRPNARELVSHFQLHRQVARFPKARHAWAQQLQQFVQEHRQ